MTKVLSAFFSLLEAIGHLTLIVFWSIILQFVRLVNPQHGFLNLDSQSEYLEVKTQFEDSRENFSSGRISEEQFVEVCLVSLRGFARIMQRTVLGS